MTQWWSHENIMHFECFLGDSLNIEEKIEVEMDWGCELVKQDQRNVLKEGVGEKY